MRPNFSSTKPFTEGFALAPSFVSKRFFGGPSYDDTFQHRQSRQPPQGSRLSPGGRGQAHTAAAARAPHATFGKGQGAAKERAKLQARIDGRGPKKGDHKPEAAPATGKTEGQPTGAPHADGGNPYKKKNKQNRGH
jgi:hypothetical protein